MNDKKTLDSISHMKDIEIFFQQKKGYGSALIEGINDADTEFFCIINADGSMDPKYLNQMFENIKVKKYKISKILNRFKNASLPNYEIIDLNKTINITKIKIRTIPNDFICELNND